MLVGLCVGVYFNHHNSIIQMWRIRRILVHETSTDKLANYGPSIDYLECNLLFIALSTLQHINQLIK